MPMYTPAAVRRIQEWVNKSIQRQLLLWSIGFWIISITVLGLTFFGVGQAQIINETRQRNVRLASIIGRDINAQVSGIFADIRTFSRHLEETDPDLRSQAAAMVALRLSSQRYRSLYYFDASGNLVMYLNDTQNNLLSLDPATVATRPPVPVGPEITSASRSVEGPSIYVADVRFSSIDRTPITYASVPVSFQGEDRRTVVLELDYQDIWRRIDLSTIGETGFTYVVSRDGTIIAHPEPANIGQAAPPEVRPVVSDFEGFTEYTEPVRKKPVFAAYSPVGGPAGWGIVVVQDKSEAYAPIYKAGILIGSVWLALASIGTLSILLMIRSFTKPIIKLTRTTKNIARTGDLATTGTEKRTDEVGQLASAFDQMIERLQTSEGRLAQAAAEERNRLARDLHDAVSQTLFSASLIADVLPKIWERNPDEGRRRLDEVRQLTRGALAEMRTLLLELRPAALAEAELRDLLRQLAESITGRSRVPVTLTIEGECSIPTEVKVALYRIAQESLNNTVKHAQAKQARMVLSCAPKKVSLVVADNGNGFDGTRIAPDSLGLGIMRERAKKIGAVLTIESKPGQGTRTTVAWEQQ